MTTERPTFIEAQQAAHAALRMRRKHRVTCTGCEACESDAEGRKAARDE